jgi:EAL domain-containing protein (putative c-di-GMP-specific phosphodiesterase class I)
MDKIDRWVVHTLFSTQADNYRRSWQECQTRGCERIYAVNLSGASINDDRFADFLYEQFESHGIPPQVICFEITETVAIRNLARASALIRHLKELGCRFALDDFGSGMSSFSYLKSLPVDFLKIDGRFVKDILDAPIDREIVRSINQIAHLMGIKTIAEFVENDAILAAVRDLGTDYAQGYGIARPAPLPSACRCASA